VFATQLKDYYLVLFYDATILPTKSSSYNNSKRKIKVTDLEQRLAIAFVNKDIMKFLFTKCDMTTVKKVHGTVTGIRVYYLTHLIAQSYLAKIIEWKKNLIILLDDTTINDIKFEIKNKCVSVYLKRQKPARRQYL
jgi:hypothetical protein